MPGTEQRFRLSVQVQIQQLRAPYPDAPAEHWQPISYPGLEVRDGFNVTARGFLEIASILGRFHTLAEELQAEEAASNAG